MIAPHMQHLQSCFPFLAADVVGATLNRFNGDLEAAASHLLEQKGRQGLKRSIDEVVDVDDVLLVCGSPIVRTPTEQKAPDVECIDDAVTQREPVEESDSIIQIQDAEVRTADDNDDVQCIESNVPLSQTSASSSSSRGSTPSSQDVAKLCAKERRLLNIRRLREERDAAVAKELARQWRQQERHQMQARVVLQKDIDMAAALQLEEGGLQSTCGICDAICLSRPSAAKFAAACSRDECSQRSKTMCFKLLACGHPCNGLSSEESCNVPCCRCGDCKDESCGVCLDKLSESPVIRLDCGHCVHYGCAINMIESIDWKGRKIAFAALECLSGCGKLLSHPSLAAKMAPILAKHAQIAKNVKYRAAQDAEKKDKDDKVNTDDSASLKKLLAKYNYYECFRCREPYFGGLAECGEGAQDPEPEAVQCPSCVLDGKGGVCAKHGAEFMAIKCDFCCNEALFNCHADSTMYCDVCHHDNLSQKVKPCDPSKCPLGGKHPAGRTRKYAMGCAACRCEMIG